MTQEKLKLADELRQSEAVITDNVRRFIDHHMNQVRGMSKYLAEKNSDYRSISFFLSNVKDTAFLYGLMDRDDNADCTLNSLERTIQIFKEAFEKEGFQVSVDLFSSFQLVVKW